MSRTSQRFYYLFSILSLFISGWMGGKAAGQCTLGGSTSQTNILCSGSNTGDASVIATGGTLPYTYSWSTGASTSAISNLSAGTYVSTVIDSSCIISGVELVTNGDFSAGNLGFTSTYTACVPNCSEGSYAIGPNPNAVHAAWCACTDHTSGSGNFMIINGASNPGTDVWCQTIAVTPNTNYNFSTWVLSQYTVSPAQLQFSINGTSLCSAFTAPSTCCTWQQFFCVWNSGSSTSATICILNMNTTLGGNDFGLDDISFMSCAPCTVTHTVTITEPPPLAIIGTSADEFCSRSDGTVSITATGGNGAYTYAWTPSVTTAASASGLAAGSYSVTVSDANGCSHDTVLAVNFIPGPTVNAGTDASMCSGSTLTLGANGGGAYLWSPSAGLSNSVVSNPVFSSTVSATYTVTVTDTNNCTASDSLAIAVYSAPEVSFTATSVCFTNATVFSGFANGPVAQWSWDFGEPSSGANNFSSLQNPIHTYNNHGTFIATLVITSPEGCKDSISQNITVHPLPLVAFTSSTVCIGSPTQFTDMSSVTPGAISSWSWNFDDPASGAANTSGIQDPTHVFTAVGNFNVLLTVTSNNGCQNLTTLQAVVLFPPVAAFSFSDTCVNSTVQFTDQSVNAINWNWTFGDGGTSNLQHPAHTYTASGDFIVTLIGSSTGTCADTLADTITVFPPPVVNFLPDTVCQGDTTSFINMSYISSGTIAAWHWDFGDGNTSVLQNPAHIYSSAGDFTVTLTAVSGNGCTNSISGSAHVFPLPLADFSFSPAPTAELIDEVLFTDLSTGNPVQWWWEFGDGDTSGVQNPSHFYSDTGLFVVTLVVTSSDGCVDTARYNAEVKDFAFYIPNTFSPNGDDLNELFFGKGIGVQEYELIIFDRWGNRVFYCKVNDLPQTPLCMWDGKVEGGNSNKLAQEDVYVWKVNLVSVFGKPYHYVGHVNIIR